MGITAVVFDWAGTVIDPGSCAPVAALQDVFASAGVPVAEDEVRASMGLAKRDHIAALFEIPRVSEAWQSVYGAPASEADVDGLYADFVPKQLACLDQYSDLIPGVVEVAAELRNRGVRIGSTTGYTRPMLDLLLARAAEQGFEPDCAICPEDVPGGGRPAPWMCYLNAVEMATGPLWTMVKVGDTPSDIEEGLNAGMWTVGVSTGNEAQQVEEDRLGEAGAHYVIDSVADFLAVADEIEDRIAAGERP